MGLYTRRATFARLFVYNPFNLYSELYKNTKMVFELIESIDDLTKFYAKHYKFH